VIGELEALLRSVAEKVELLCTDREVEPEWAFVAVALQEALEETRPCPLPAFAKVLHAIDRLASGRLYRRAVRELN
jgi:hypothetical protein